MKPTLRGSLPRNALGFRVRRVELLATYPDHTAPLAEYPFLEARDLQQTLRYAAAAVDDERLSIDRVVGGSFDWIRDSLHVRRQF